jgi:hypothetical protein
MEEKVSDDVRIIFDGDITFSTSFIDEMMMNRTASNNRSKSLAGISFVFFLLFTYDDKSIGEQTEKRYKMTSIDKDSTQSWHMRTIRITLY